jgi:glucose-6-phosphate dehydrogenase assembly protein OpcA
VASSLTIEGPPDQIQSWVGHDVSLAEVDHELASLREQASSQPEVRTNVLTAIAWVPERWRTAAERVLAGIVERHPSRTIIFVPDADAEDGIDAEIAIRCRPYPGDPTRNVCFELLRLRLRGRRMRAPGSIVEPLLIPDLPVFVRWRGQPDFAQSQFDQLVAVTDRLVVDSREWTDIPGAYAQLTSVFEGAAVSDIAWGLTQPWRASLAKRWPAICAVEELRVVGPAAQAHMLGGWLRSRLRKDIRLVHEDAEELERIETDGEAVDAPRVPTQSDASLLSEEWEAYGRDRVYEAAVRAAAM